MVPLLDLTPAIAEVFLAVAAMALLMVGVFSRETDVARNVTPLAVLALGVTLVLVVLTGDEVPAFFRQRLSPHQVGLSDVFATLLLTGRAPRAIVVIGVQPVVIETGLALSPPVAAAVPRVLAEISGAQHAFDIFHSIRSAHVIRAVQRFLEWSYVQHRKRQTSPP